MRLEGQLVSLRAVEPDDLDLLYQWENNPALWHLSNTVEPYSKQVLKEFIKGAKMDIYITKQLRLMIHTKKYGAVGCIDLYDFDATNQRAGVGILIANEQYRGKGFASESLEILCNYGFSILRLNQLYCSINANNQASIHLFTKLGFVQTGNKQQWNRTRSGYVDELFFQLIAH
ncbi:MAG: GNAT family N-acetyltransferase [Bacteroidia bacterium]|nr:GNAT family N-acetyltransferase [Bacteroidia bacterium]MCZ2247886.1 GNAT family N-acetyltransferase [Bacteroidia bacterium]